MTVVTGPAIRVVREDGIATITLDRPPLNVLTTAMLAELDVAIGELEVVHDLRLIVLRGAGRVFSAGVDVGEHIGDALDGMLDAFARVSLRLLACDVPTLAVVHGAALGGACELVALCDLAIATDDARLGTPEIALGVVPPVAAALFPARIGEQRSRALVLTGEPIGGVEAAAWGLVWKCVPAARLDEEIARVALRFRAMSAASLRLAKRTFRAAAGASPADAVTAADLEQRRSLHELHDATEGLQAFLEKRPPRWEHR